MDRARPAFFGMWWRGEGARVRRLPGRDATPSLPPSSTDLLKIHSHGAVAILFCDKRQCSGLAGKRNVASPTYRPTDRVPPRSWKLAEFVSTGLCLHANPRLYTVSLYHVRFITYRWAALSSTPSPKSIRSSVSQSVCLQYLPRPDIHRGHCTNAKEDRDKRKEGRRGHRRTEGWEGRPACLCVCVCVCVCKPAGVALSAKGSIATTACF